MQWRTTVSLFVPPSPSSLFKPTFRSLFFDSPANNLFAEGESACPGDILRRPKITFLPTPTDIYRYSVGGIHHGEFTFPHTYTRTRERVGCVAMGTHATDTHECLMPADSDFHPRRESAPPTSSRFRSARPVHPFCGQMGFSRPHPALTYSPRCCT